MLLEVDPNESVEIIHVQQIAEAIKELGAGKKYPLLILAGPNTLPSAETRVYMASAESDPYASAEAYVISSFSQKLAGNLYLNFNKPFRPTRIFTDKEKAIEWLEGFLLRKKG